VKLTRCVSLGGIEYPHFGHSVVNDAMIFSRLIRRMMVSILGQMLKLIHSENLEYKELRRAAA
jgi:hypothetical protein